MVLNPPKTKIFGVWLPLRIGPPLKLPFFINLSLSKYNMIKRHWADIVRILVNLFVVLVVTKQI